MLPAALGGPFGFCDALAGNGFTVQDGEAADLDGNPLPGTPELVVQGRRAVHVLARQQLGLTMRADYYWRDEFYARIFNRPIDKIEAWDVVNAQVELGSRSNSWYVRGYVYNVMDDDNITGMYVTDASSDCSRTCSCSIRARTGWRSGSGSDRGAALPCCPGSRGRHQSKPRNVANSSSCARSVRSLLTGALSSM